MKCRYFTQVFTCIPKSLAWLKVIGGCSFLQEWFKHGTVYSVTSHQDPLPKKWACLQKLDLNGSKPSLVSQHSQLSFQKSTSLCHPLTSVKKIINLLETIYQTTALPTLLFRDLKASEALATQTLQHSIVQRMGRMSLDPRTDACINWLCNCLCTFLSLCLCFHN